MKEVKIKDKTHYKIRGRPRLILRNIHTGEVEIRELENLHTDKGKLLVLLSLGNKETGITYSAIGTDDGTILTLAVTNTTLGAEVGREVITGFTYNEGALSGKFYSFYSANYPDTTYTIEEVGLFGGDDASSTADSGKMAFRAYVSPSVTKTTGTHTLTVEYEIDYP